MNNPYANQPGNYYVSITLSLNPQTYDYHLNSEYPHLFPDWNDDWFDRKYFTVCTIKNLNNPISIKFHDTSFTSIPITIEDIPAIIEPFNFRDVFLSNDKLEHANFDITLWNGQGIEAPPPKPTDLSLALNDSGDVVLTFMDNSVDEKLFVIERSSTSATEGFVIVKEFFPNGIKQTLRNSRELSYTDTTTISTTQYWYRVRSRRTSGFASPHSNISNITTL